MKLLLQFISLILIVGCSSKSLALSEYEGLYEYENDSTLMMVAGPKRKILYAVINQARYPLRPSGKDIFLNIGDVEVEFVRNSKQKIIGYRENKKDNVDANTIFSLLDSKVRLPPSIWVAKPKLAPSQYIYQAPEALNDGIPIRDLEVTAPLAKHLSLLTNAIYNEKYPYTQSVLLYQNGALVYEEYFYEFDKERHHQLRSATKTLIAILAGIAIDRKLISSINAPVLPYFNEYKDLKNVDQRKRNLTIKDLLTMQSGFDCNDWEPESQGNESKMIFSKDWARFILDLPMTNKPGLVGSYCSGNVILMGRIIEKSSGKSLKEFANKFLFNRLGIDDYQWDFRPDSSNINNFVQAWMRPRDMMKIGILINNYGKYQELQIVSNEWISALMAPQSKINNTDYGYFFWERAIFPDGKQRVEIPQMSGNGGQKVILLKEHNAIVVLTGGNYNKSSYTNEILAYYILKGLVQ